MDNLVHPNKQTIITLSGFGPFGDVKVNPTMELIESFTTEEKLKYNIKVCRVVEVSTIACDHHIKQEVCE